MSYFKQSIKSIVTKTAKVTREMGRKAFADQLACEPPLFHFITKGASSSQTSVPG